MANFSTHLAVGAMVAGTGSALLVAAQVIVPWEALLCFAMGTVGGLLPDLDADNSAPLALAFSLLGTVFSFLLLFLLASRLSIAESILIWAGGFLFFRFVLFFVFIRLTAHRGIIHSLPMAVFFAALTAVILHHLFRVGAASSWLAAFFILLGCVTHLILDELYSLNLGGWETKGSLGSALKLYSRNLPATLLAYALAALLLYLAPPPKAAWDRLTAPDLKQRVAERLWPKQGWFLTYP